MDQQYYCRIGEKAHGPFTVEQLRKLAKEGRINPQTMVCRYGSGDWVQADLVAGLFTPAKTEKITAKDMRATRRSKSNKGILLVFAAVMLLGIGIGIGYALVANKGGKDESDTNDTASNSQSQKQVDQQRIAEQRQRIESERLLEQQRMREELVRQAEEREREVARQRDQERQRAEKQAFDLLIKMEENPSQFVGKTFTVDTLVGKVTLEEVSFEGPKLYVVRVGVVVGNEGRRIGAGIPLGTDCLYFALFDKDMARSVIRQFPSNVWTRARITFKLSRVPVLDLDRTIHHFIGSVESVEPR